MRIALRVCGVAHAVVGGGGVGDERLRDEARERDEARLRGGMAWLLCKLWGDVWMSVSCGCRGM
jgi:hypothetical protein